MFHSKKTAFVLLLAAVGLCSCNQKEDLTDNFSNEGESSAGNVVFHLVTNNALTAIARSAEDSYVPEQGTPDEYKVNNAWVYLFDNPTKLFAKKIQLTNLKKSHTDQNGNVVYETEHVSVAPGTYDIFVTANTNRQLSTASEEEFLADIDNATYARALIEDVSNGIVMSNRANANTPVVISKNATGDDNVVYVTLERVLARLDIAKGANSYQLTDNNANLYATVSLDGYEIVNLAKNYYTFRHTADLTTLTEPEWNLSENFGVVSDVRGYVIDPYFFKKTVDASTFTNADKYYENFLSMFSEPNAVTWKTLPSEPEYNTAYCLENCALQPAQKNGYSTGVVFKATFSPNNSVFHLNPTTQAMELITDPSLYPEVLYYYQYKFYDSAEALAQAIGVTSVAGVSLDMVRAKKFEKSNDGKYHCYYTYWIRHLDNNNNSEMGVMEFGIVRNNLYRMNITNVTGLGYLVPSTDPDIPDEGETFLKVMLNVKPWIVRPINIVL